jgi:hypothetical protein
MRTAARAVRACEFAAGLLLATGRTGSALTIEASLSPGTQVPLGTVVTLTATLTSDSSGLGELDAVTGMHETGCPGAVSWYTIYADDPLVVTAAAPSSTFVDFGYTAGIAQVVTWAFTATRTGTATFSLVAHDGMMGVSEGCAGPDRDAFGTPVCPKPDLPSSPAVCGFLTVRVTSPLEGRADLQSAAAGRPAGTVYIEDTVRLVMSVTNTGGTDVTISAAVASTAWAASNAAFVAGTAPAMPRLVGAGASDFLTWTFDVPPDATPGTVLAFHADAERTLARSNQVQVLAAPLTVSVTLWVDPDGASSTAYGLAPADRSWTLVNDEVWVVATVRNDSAAPIVVDPALLSQDSDGSGRPDFALLAPRDPAGAQTLGGFASQAFTWRTRLDRTVDQGLPAYDAEYYHTCWSVFFPPDPMTWTVRTRGRTARASLPVDPSPFGFSIERPPVVTVGDVFTATVWVENLAGRAVVLDASATVFVTPQSAPHRVTVLSGPPPGNRTFAPGGRLPFVFTLSADAAGNQTLYGGILFGPAVNPDAPCFLGPTSSLEITAPVPLVVGMTVSATTVNQLEPYRLTLAAFNSSTCTVNVTDVQGPFGLDERPYLASAIEGPAFAGCAGLPCAVPAGATVYFTWTATANNQGCGTVDWSATLLGDWGACGPDGFSRPYASPVVRIRQRAALSDLYSVGWSWAKAWATESQVFDVVVRVDPAGENDLANFSLAPSIHYSNTWSGIAISLVSAPAIPATLPGCGRCVTNTCPDRRATFTWRYRADSAGTAPGFARVWLTYTAAGEDSLDGTPVASRTITGELLILRPSTLATSIWVEPELDPSCRIVVVANVQVIGQTEVVPAALDVFPADPSRVALAEAPAVPPLLAPDSDNLFFWTFSPAGAGCVDFTVSVTGWEVELGGTVFAASSTAGARCLRPAALSASAWTNRSSLTTGAGQTVTVVFSVSNSGDVPADSLAVSATATGSAACGAFPLVGPILSSTIFPDVSFGLGGCGERMFWLWTFSTTHTGDGDVVFSVTVTGTERGSGAPLLAAAVTGCVTILPRPPAVVRLGGATPSVLQGREGDATVVLENRGATPLVLTPGAEVLRFSIAQAAVVAPPGVVTVPPNAERTVTVRFRVSPGAPAGEVLVTLAPGAYAAKDGSTFAPVPVDLSPAPARFTVVPAEWSVALSENPWRPRRAPLDLTFTLLEPGPVSVRVYDLSGQLIRSIVSETLPPGRHVRSWDGRTEAGQALAAGIYLLRFESPGLKVTRKLAVLK